MATSSLTHNFVISDPDAAERFVAALEVSESHRTPIRASKAPELTNKEDILSLAKIIIAKQRTRT